MNNVFNSKVILMVDDDEDDRFFFSEAAGKLNIRCIAADNANTALDMLNTILSLPDIIFLDINMPGTGGVDFLKKIRQCPILGKIPVFIYSTTRLEETYRETLMLGALDYYTKPLLTEQIADCISAAMKTLFSVKAETSI